MNSLNAKIGRVIRTKKRPQQLSPSLSQSELLKSGLIVSQTFLNPRKLS